MSEGVKMFVSRAKLVLAVAVAAVAVAGTVAAQEAATSQSGTTSSSSPATPLERANRDAVAKLYAQIAAERIDGVPLSTILDRVDVRQVVLEGLATAEQIGGPRTVAEGFVQVTLEISGERAAGLVVRAAAADPPRGAASSQQMAELAKRWSSRSFRGTGDSGTLVDGRSAGATNDPVTPTTMPVLPEVSPDWVNDAFTAAAVAESTGAPLRTARAAERAARVALRGQLGELRFDAARQLDSIGRRSREALDSAVAAAKISGVDYRADGSVEVRVTVDGRQLWHALQLQLRPD